MCFFVVYLQYQLKQQKTKDMKTQKQTNTMKAELTLENLLNNQRLMNLFFRNQSTETLLELFESVEDNKRQLASNIEDYSEDLEEIEEIFYNESVEDIIEIFCLRPINK